MSEIPAYYDIDIVTGAPKHATKEPIKGWAITHPVVGSELFYNEEEADTRINEIAGSNIKWPTHTSKFKAWIHTEGNRKHWTPR